MLNIYKTKQKQQIHQAFHYKIPDYQKLKRYKLTAEASAALEELGRLWRLSGGLILHAEEIELDGGIQFRHFRGAFGACLLAFRERDKDEGNVIEECDKGRVGPRKNNK